MVSRGSWGDLIRASAKCDELAAVSRRRQTRRFGVDDNIKRRAARTEMVFFNKALERTAVQKDVPNLEILCPVG